ncbi:hypothetical protein SAMD00079811_70790 [Scytonema sp. HK-05]|uniref:hypothetical protein n=1 Tax=Scytonema sp. HK-05 TaxID=1137095 RepID=UPI000935D1AE|nr:hypothetical protein [Scytonema sp. HK-05]OKH57050.1 hypothetical protein NIES2130_22360 [Scytonema sp. HK-05]BAY49450.1 hypothetical protein SAMD00079811_70790 [Scytonema sp. HK-05]
MSKQIQIQKNSELFTDVSGEEQEAMCGGRSSSSLDLYDLVIQMTNIRSFASSEATYSDGTSSVSSRQQSGYMLSQLSFGFSGGGLNGGGGRRKRKSKGLSSANFLNMLFGLMSLL